MATFNYFDTATNRNMDYNNGNAATPLRQAAFLLLTLGQVADLEEGFRAAVNMAETGRLDTFPGVHIWIRTTKNELDDALLVCGYRDLERDAYRRNFDATTARLANAALVRENARIDRRADRIDL